MEKKKKTLRELRTDADSMSEAGIKTKEALLAALPVLIELQNAVAGHRKALNGAAAAGVALSELCTDYATKHPSVFEGGKLIEDQQKVLSGDIRTEKDTYHLACGYNGYQRINPRDKLTRDFLLTLPEKWCKKTLEISTTGINSEHPTDKELVKYGLKEKPQNVWSLKLVVDI